ncbi:MAG: carboxypeptidase regulatory-like domain-containing protein, partial [Planctomycetota bacterium]
MKPIHLLMAAALLGVGALAFFLLQSDDKGRQGARTGAERTRAKDADPERGVPEEPTTSLKLAAGQHGLTVSVRMPDGSPAGGAELRIRDPRGDSIAARTERSGSLVLSGIAPGRYAIQASKDGAVGALNFNLDSGTAEQMIEMHDALTVRGHVYDAQGAAIVGATVEAVRGTASLARFDFTAIFRRIGEPDDLVASAETDGEGAYVLYLPGAGSYGLRAHSDTHGQEHEPARDIPRDLQGVDFHLFPAAFVEGRVVDEGGRPVAGAHVFLAGMAAVFGGGAPKVESIADELGQFRIAAAAVAGDGGMGGTLLTARAPGYAARINSRVQIPSSGVEIVMERGATLRLRAMDASMPGRPASGVSVAVIFGQGYAQGRSDQDGYVVVEHLPTRTDGRQGRERMAILTSDEFVTQMVDLKKFEVVDGVLELGVVPMERGGIIRGVVRDKQTNEPVAGATVQAMGGLPNQMAMMGGSIVRADEKGKYELPGVPLKATAVMGRHPDYLVDIRANPMLARGMSGGGAPTAALFPDGKTEIEKDVLLTPGGTLRGVVTNAAGEPVEGAKVTTQLGNEMRFMAMLAGGAPTAYTQADGSFALKPVATDKKHILLATHKDFGPSKPLEAAANSDSTLELTAPLDIVGVIHDDAGQPLQGVKVTLGSRPRQGMGLPQEGMPRPGISDDAGRFVIRNAPRGNRTIIYFHPHHLLKSEQLQLGAGARHDAGTVVLERGLRITGTVVDEDGKPIVGARLFANAVQQNKTVRRGPERLGGATQDQSDSVGKFGFYGLQPGSFRLSVSSDGYYGSPSTVAAGTDEHRIVMVKAAVLKGIVQSEGRPVADARIQAVIEGGNNAWAQSGPDGRFTLDQLPPGQPFQLTIRHDLYRNLVVESATASAGEQQFDLDVGRVIEGIVVDGQGRPVAGARVQIRPNWRSAVSGADG